MQIANTSTYNTTSSTVKTDFHRATCQSVLMAHCDRDDILMLERYLMEFRLSVVTDWHRFPLSITLICEKDLVKQFEIPALLMVLPAKTDVLVHSSIQSDATNVRSEPNAIWPQACARLVYFILYWGVGRAVSDPSPGIARYRGSGGIADTTSHWNRGWERTSGESAHLETCWQASRYANISTM